MLVKNLKPSNIEAWLFPDRFTEGKEYIFDINSYEMQKAKSGEDFPVLSACGTDGEWIGDFKISVWERDISPIVEAYGEDSSKWKGKRVIILKSKDRMILKPVNSEKKEQGTQEEAA